MSPAGSFSKIELCAGCHRALPDSGDANFLLIPLPLDAELVTAEQKSKDKELVSRPSARQTPPSDRPRSSARSSAETPPTLRK